MWSITRIPLSISVLQPLLRIQIKLDIHTYTSFATFMFVVRLYVSSVCSVLSGYNKKQDVRKENGVRSTWQSSGLVLKLMITSVKLAIQTLFLYELNIPRTCSILCIETKRAFKYKNQQALGTRLAMESFLLYVQSLFWKKHVNGCIFLLIFFYYFPHTTPCLTTSKLSVRKAHDQHFLGMFLKPAHPSS